MIHILKWVCRIFIFLGFYVVGMFLYAYTPTVDDEQLVQAIYTKIDELAVQDIDALEPLYERISSIRQQKIKQETYPEWKLYVLQELESYLYTKYIDIEPAGPDFISDSSLLKFVSRGVGYQNKYYIPADLTMLFPNESLTLAASEEISYMMISESVLPRLQELAFAYDDEFGIPMKINSVWRSFEFQRDGFSQECRDSGLCAEPGYSEHQSGLAVDINGMYGEYYLWMQENAHKYGFHQSYQKGAEIDGYAEEKWHWRFVGEDFATELKESDLTFTEWVRLNQTDTGLE